MKTCQEEKLMGHLGVVLYEYLGEEYPEVLGSILAALKAIVNVIGMHKMTPPIKDLLPRLTPILKVYFYSKIMIIVDTFKQTVFCFSYFTEPTRKSAGELHRFSRTYSRSWTRVCVSP